ncbi:MAG: hypothetical protein M1822_003462 [Bathelium mastoideum]|nr:MAG: hypothetical protein M1822_003462 [Bathelium mastoideum]
MPLTIRNMKAEDIPDAVTVVQQAFANDPYSRWVFNDRERFSLSRNRISLSLRCQWGIRHALFQVAHEEERLVGVAMWLPPVLSTPLPSWASWVAGQYASWDLWIKQGIANMFHGRSTLNIRRYYLWKEGQAKAQNELWKDPQGYYFCNIITVAPDAQGRGIGKALMEEVLKRADAEGRSAYLESSCYEPNVKIYEKMGFELKRELPLTDEGDDITLYCMTRPSKEVKS